MQFEIIRTIRIIILAIQSILLFGYNLLCIGGPNHTSINVIFWAYLSFLLGTLFFILNKYLPDYFGNMDKISKAIIILSIIIGLNILLFDYFNIMLNYDDWLERGLPISPFSF